MARAERESGRLRAFRAVWEEGNRAWDDGDFKRTYGGLPDDFDYRPLESWPHARPLRGPAEIVPFFEDFQESFPDVRTEVLEFIEGDERTVIVGFRVIGTGESSGASTEMEVWQVWEVREASELMPPRSATGLGMVPFRVREFGHRGAALKAAGAGTRDREAP